jgi:hypothetical protein
VSLSLHPLVRDDLGARLTEAYRDLVSLWVAAYLRPDEGRQRTEGRGDQNVEPLDGEKEEAVTRIWTASKLLLAWGLFKLDRKITVAWSARILRTCDVPGHEHGVTILADKLEGRRP